MANKKENEPVQGVDLSTVQEQLAAMLAEAKAESAKIVENAKAEAAKIVDEAKNAVKAPSGMTAEEMAAHQAYMNEEVEVKLFKDNGKYKDPVFVSCNGETIAIQRGERVKIKRKFAEILENSEHQDYEAALLVERKSAEFERLNR